MTIIKPGTAEWIDELKTLLRQRRHLPQGADLGVKVVPVDVDMDENDDHVFTARITKNISDRDDEALLPAGMIASEFDVSGAVFWNHDYDRPIAVPVGKLGKSDDAVIAKAQFLRRPDNHVGEFFPDFARAFISQMSKLGRRPGVSVGFIPLESRLPSEKDKKEYGQQLKRVFTRWKLLEWSIAPVQANPEAYVTAVGKSIGAGACKALFGVDPPPEPPEVSGAPSQESKSVADAAAESMTTLDDATLQRIATIAATQRMSLRARKAFQAAVRQRVADKQAAAQRRKLMHNLAVKQSMAQLRGYPMYVGTND
jgi:hypothetical protein